MCLCVCVCVYAHATYLSPTKKYQVFIYTRSVRVPATPVSIETVTAVGTQLKQAGFFFIGTVRQQACGNLSALCRVSLSGPPAPSFTSCKYQYYSCMRCKQDCQIPGALEKLRRLADHPTAVVAVGCINININQILSLGLDSVSHKPVHTCNTYIPLVVFQKVQAIRFNGPSLFSSSFRGCHTILLYQRTR